MVTGRAVADQAEVEKRISQASRAFKH